MPHNKPNNCKTCYRPIIECIKSEDENFCVVCLCADINDKAKEAGRLAPVKDMVCMEFMRLK